MKIFKLELRRALFNKWTSISFIIGFVICLIPLWDKLMYMTEFYNNMSSGGDKVICTATPYENWLLYDLSESLHYVYLFIMPLLAVLSFGASYYMDLKLGYVKQLVTKCGSKKYLCAKYGSTFISGGVVVAIPLLLQLMLLALIFPLNNPFRFESMFISENSPSIDLLVCALYCVGVYATHNKYTLPDVEYYGLNDTAIYKGLNIKMTDMKTYTLEELCEAYNFTPEQINHQTDFEKIYYAATFEIEKISEKGNLMDVDVGKYNKYISGNYTEVPIEMFINGGVLVNRKLEVGEKTEYIFVKSLIDYQFTEETFKKLDEDDLWIRIYDEERGCEYYFGVDL